jgi:hypothetical protein
MKLSSHHRRNCRRIPRGIATLEFVMALPILLLLMVGITWLAFSVIGQAEVLVKARNDAWRERFKNLSDKPLIFPSGLGAVRNPLYSEEKDYVNKSVSKKIDVSPVFNGIAGPKASVMVLAGSWDHRAMDMNKPPNLKLYAIAAANAVTKDLQTKLSQLDSLINNLENFGAVAIAQAITSSKDAANSKSNTESTGNSGSAQADKEKADKKKEIQDQQQKLGGVVGPGPPFGTSDVVPTSGGELDQTNDEITRLQIDLDFKRKQPALKDEKEEKKRLEELNKEERQLQLLKDKKQRLEEEIKDNDEELKGYD